MTDIEQRARALVRELQQKAVLFSKYGEATGLDDGEALLLLTRALKAERHLVLRQVQEMLDQRIREREEGEVRSG